MVKISKKGFEPGLFYFFLADLRVIGGPFGTATSFGWWRRRCRVFVCVDSGGGVCGGVRRVVRPLYPVRDAAAAHFLQVIPTISSTFPSEQRKPCIRPLQTAHFIPLPIIVSSSCCLHWSPAQHNNGAGFFGACFFCVGFFFGTTAAAALVRLAARSARDSSVLRI